MVELAPEQPTFEPLLAEDELLLGRYCIYLSTHLEKEVLGGQVLSQESLRVTKVYSI